MSWIGPAAKKVVKYGPHAQQIWKHVGKPAQATARKQWAVWAARRTALQHADTLADGSVLGVMHHGERHWVVFSADDHAEGPRAVHHQRTGAGGRAGVDRCPRRDGGSRRRSDRGARAASPTALPRSDSTSSSRKPTSCGCRSASTPRCSVSTASAAGVVLRPFPGVGVRITIGTPGENDRLLRVLASAVDDGATG